MLYKFFDSKFLSLLYTLYTMNVEINTDKNLNILINRFRYYSVNKHLLMLLDICG